MASNIPFCQMVRSSGAAEPWTHVHEESKFDQFGWRCTTKESGYGTSTLIGNCNERRFDIRERMQNKPLPSQTKSGQVDISVPVKAAQSSGHPYGCSHDIPRLSDEGQLDKWMSRPYNHYFTTTYSTDFNKGHPKVPVEIQGLKRRNPNSFPGHQPEFDTAQAKGVYNDWNTTSSASYKDYSRRNMMQTQPCEQVPQEMQQEYIVQMETTPITHLGARAGPAAPGGHVIAPPHAGPGTGTGAHRTTDIKGLVRP